MEIILLNSNKGYNNRLGYLESLMIRIRKSIHKLEDNETFKDLITNVIPVNDFGE